MKKNYIITLVLSLVFLGVSASYGQVIDDDFEDGDISGWTEGTASDWTNSTTSPITGSRSLKHNLSSVEEESYIYHDISSLDLATQNITWQFNLANGSWDPSSSNRFWVYLTANETDLGSSTVDGYAVGVNLSGTTDIVTLWKVTDGAADGAIVTSSFDWGSSDTVGIRVTRSTSGEWELLLDTDGGFDALSSAGTATNTDYTHDDYFGLFFDFSSSRAGLLWMDDVTVEGVAPSSDPTVTFDSSSSSENETDATFSVDIPVTLTNYDADVTISVTVDGASTAEGGDYTLNTTSLVFDANETLNISLDINDDADTDDETVILNIAVSSGTADLGTSQHTVTITDDETPPAPTLIITEIADPDNNAGGRYVEIYNTGDSDIDFSAEGIELRRYTNENTTFTDFSMSGTIAAKSFYIVGQSGFSSAYGFSPDESTSNIVADSNGDDQIALVKDDAVFDIFGVIGEDGTGTCHEFEDGRAERIASSKSPSASWSDADWNVWADSTIGGCISHTNDPRDAPGDFDPGAWIGAPRWAGSTDNDWATGSNWETGLAPTSDADVFINSGLTNYPTASGAVTVNTVTMQSGTSLIAQSTFSGTITYARNLGTDNWYLVGIPVSDETIEDMISNNSFASGTGSNIGWAPYDNSQATAADRWDYQTSGSTGSLTSGGGYSVKLASSGDLSFTGDMEVSDVGVSITSGAGNAFNLVGNPYPSYIAANSNADGTNNLLTINTSDLTEATLWLWDQSTSSYDVFNQASSAFYIAPGQGFFVSSTGSNTFDFTEAMQSHQSTDSFQRSTSTRPEINLVMSNGTDTRDADIFYIDGTTTGFDNGFDSSIFSGVGNSFAIYTQAVANGTGKNLGIQSLPIDNFENMIIPVGINATSGMDITISANAINLPAGINVYLEDKNDGSFTLLDSSSSFSTTLDSDLNGIGRFYLHTNTQPLSVDEINLNNLSIYPNDNNELRIIGIQNGTAQVRMYNILGKQVLNTSFEGTGANNIPLPNVRTGIYIVQLETETGKVNKKVIIE